MSDRPYITVNGNKVYDWEDARTEYTCDGCGDIIPPGTPQLHLFIGGLAFPSREKTERPYSIHQFSLDIHATADCLKNIWSPLIRHPELSPYFPETLLGSLRVG
jgi:hypothetical protein